MSEAFMPSVPMVTPSLTEMVLNSMGVPPAARMPCLDLHRQVALVEVAGHRLDPLRGDADDGLGEVLVGEAHGLEHAPRAGPIRTIGQAPRNGAWRDRTGGRRAETWLGRPRVDWFLGWAPGQCMGSGRGLRRRSRCSQASRSGGARRGRRAPGSGRARRRVEQLAPGPERAATEEGRAVLEHARRVGASLVGPRAHPRRRWRASTSSGQRASGTSMPSRPAMPAHLAVEVGRQVVVVHQHDVRLVAPGPGVAQVPQHARAASPAPRAGRRPARSSRRSQSRSGSRADRGAAGAGCAGELAQPLPVEVVALVVQRHGHVQRVAGDHDVGAPGRRAAPRPAACGS